MEPTTVSTTTTTTATTSKPVKVVVVQRPSSDLQLHQPNPMSIRLDCLVLVKQS